MSVLSIESERTVYNVSCSPGFADVTLMETIFFSSPETSITVRSSASTRRRSALNLMAVTSKQQRPVTATVSSAGPVLSCHEFLFGEKDRIYYPDQRL